MAVRFSLADHQVFTVGLKVAMAKKKRSIAKPKTVLGNSFLKNISSEYAEVLRLRQAVQRAETRNKASKSDALDARKSKDI